eukprot:scaffold1245_cov252-Pinguiococcus_pyrenoidosus.AAC.11
MSVSELSMRDASCSTRITWWNKEEKSAQDKRTVKSGVLCEMSLLFAEFPALFPSFALALLFHHRSISLRLVLIRALLLVFHLAQLLRHSALVHLPEQLVLGLRPLLLVAEALLHRLLAIHALAGLLLRSAGRRRRRDQNYEERSGGWFELLVSTLRGSRVIS